MLDLHDEHLEILNLTTAAGVVGASGGGGVVVGRHCFGGYVGAGICLIVFSARLESCVLGEDY